jgi:hypothetical protein
MKRILLALTLVGLLLPFAPRTEAAAEVSLNLFYDNLSPYGAWIDVADYGYCFQPSVAVSNSDWRPYADGYWAYTDAGWTWVSYEDFGWATYHYGRWVDLESYGWVWVPGYEWGPAWVSWRTGGDYVGWAPLPPQPGGVVYEGRAITGAIDVNFDIGPLYYNFVDIRYIGEPVLRGRIIEPRRNVTIINQTVNVTNITYNNSVVVNHGPDINRINQYSTRPVQRLSLQRETTISGEIGRGGNLNRVNGNALIVAAPAVQKSQEKLAPKQVKAKIEKPKIERGWKGVENRQQVEEAMKKENAQTVPAPSFQPQKGRQGQGAEAKPNEAGQAAQAAAPEETNKRAAGNQRGQRGERSEARQQQEQQQQQQARQSQQNTNSRQNEDRAQERNAAQERKKEQRQEAQQEHGPRQAQRAEAEQEPQPNEKAQGRAREEQKSGQTEQAQGRGNQQAEHELAQRQQKSQRAEQRQQTKERSANDRPHKAERAQQAEESLRADNAHKARAQEQQAQARRVEKPQRSERPEQARQAPPERQKQETRQQPQGQGDQQSYEGRKAKKKKHNDEAPQP